MLPRLRPCQSLLDAAEHRAIAPPLVRGERRTALDVAVHPDPYPRQIVAHERRGSRRDQSGASLPVESFGDQRQPACEIGLLLHAAARHQASLRRISGD